MAFLFNPSYDLGLVIALILFISYIAQTVYSVYFGPLSKFPGPKLAAATLLYEFYYDIICKGQYTFKIRELHKIYGACVLSRILMCVRSWNRTQPSGLQVTQEESLVWDI